MAGGPARPEPPTPPTPAAQAAAGPVDLGGVTLEVLTDGDFRLDGGAMFGVVPKALWERVAPADERNRIRLGLRPLLVRTEGLNVLVETGMGSKWSPKETDLWGLERTEGLLDALARRGLGPDDIDYVIQTHLHFDHVGGATRASGDEPVPTFARARHVVQLREWRDALSPTARNRASYLPENFRPLEAAGLLHPVDGDVDILPGVRLVRTPGHTPHHQSVLLRGSRATALCWGDVIPTRAHVPEPWIMGYDLHPTRTLATKQAWLPRAADEGWVCVWYHEPVAPLGRIVRARKGYAAGDL